MSKKSKRKTNVKSSVLVLLLMAILLIVSTYAWFTANTTVTISTLDVHVEASNGIQISADGINWKALLENTDITPGQTLDANYTNTNQISANLAPVSTTGALNSGKMDMFLGRLDADQTGVYKLTATKETDTKGTSGNYIVFDVFLKVNSATDLYLTDTSNVTVKSGTTDRGLQNAARVAFCVLGNVDANSTTSAIQSASNINTTYIWEPNYDTHTQSGANQASSVYGQSTNAGANNTALSYYGVKAAITTPELPNSTSSTYFGAVTPNYQTKATPTAATQIFGLSAGITKVRIYMWVEGQDVDCENNASGADISYSIGFTIDP